MISGNDMNRRDFVRKSLLLGATSMMSNVPSLGAHDQPIDESSKQSLSVRTSSPKKIIVGGGGIAGLSCAYELKKRGHEVVVMETAHRYGGKVHTVSEELADGLYAEFGAEGFTIPGYERYRAYLQEFNLPVVPFTHQENRIVRTKAGWLNAEQEQHRRIKEAEQVSRFNDREKRFLANNPAAHLDQLYLTDYLDKFNDEYQPFGLGYDQLDYVSIQEIYQKEGASGAALHLLGGKHVSALAKIWESYIMHRRNIWNGYQRYRVKGGNQRLIQAFAQRLQPGIFLGCRVNGVAYRASGVTVFYSEFEQDKKMDADFFVNALPVQSQKNLVFTPELPATKQYVFDNLVFEQTARIILQSRSKFWLEDPYGINLTFNDPALSDVAEVAHELSGSRAALQIRAPAGTTVRNTLRTFHEWYPGDRSKIDIEHSLIKDWSKDIHTPGCQRATFPMGQLAKLWPHTTTPVGRMYFVGGYADNRNWGMEAAVNSAYRVANEIHEF